MHVLVVIAQRYNRNELWPMLKALKAGGHDMTFTAIEGIIYDERGGKSFYVHKTLDEIESIYGYQGLVFVSGNPEDTYAHWRHPICNMLVEQANAHHYPMAGICASVPALGPALRGVHVSSYPIIRVREELTWRGAIIEEVSLTTDRWFVTAENEAMAGMWSENYLCLLEDRPVKHVLQQSAFKRDVRPLTPIYEVEYLKKLRELRQGDNNANDDLPSK